MRDKIACAQYITVLSDGFIKRTLQLEGVSSLNSTIEKAKAIKVIHKVKGKVLTGREEIIILENKRTREKRRPLVRRKNSLVREGRDYKEKESVGQKGKIRKRFLRKSVGSAGKRGISVRKIRN